VDVLDDDRFAAFGGHPRRPFAEAVRGAHLLLLGEVDGGVQLQNALVVEQEKGAAVEVIVAFEKAHPLFDRLLDLRAACQGDGDLVQEFDLLVGKGQGAGLALWLVGDAGRVEIHVASFVVSVKIGSVIIEL